MVSSSVAPSEIEFRTPVVHVFAYSCECRPSVLICLVCMNSVVMTAKQNSFIFTPEYKSDITPIIKTQIA